LETLGVKPQNVYIIASEGPGDPARPAAESGFSYYLKRRSSASETMNPNPGQPPELTERSNHLRAFTVSPLTRCQFPSP